jgi:hypothetical protein
MSVEGNWEHFFKAEVRSAGSALLKKDAVHLQRGSDTEVNAYVRAGTPAKVAFRSNSISSKDFFVDCSCAAAKKGQFCKHIWATLLLVEKKSPDFLDAKETIEKASAPGTTAPENPIRDGDKRASPKTPFPATRPVTQAQLDYKKKQADYRKQAYQTQKERMKERKSQLGSAAKRDRHDEGSPSKLSVSLPAEVQAAVQYFDSNGFPMQPPFEEATINQAKRTLSRVFHPDRGGSHEEVVELLKHAEVLLEYSKRL